MVTIARVLRWTLSGLGALWALPNTLLGLLAGVVALPFGARAQVSRRECALVFHRFPWGPGGAITLGNTILHTGLSLDTPCKPYRLPTDGDDCPSLRIGDHERAHVFQYMVLGPLFLPVYLICGGISARNPFERAADRYALTGRGWWP